jgi:hypothetical protein
MKGEPWKNNGRWLPWWISFSQTWGGRGQGRYWKRLLSKIRRRAWRDPHRRGLAGIESRVNWKDW